MNCPHNRAYYGRELERGHGLPPIPIGNCVDCNEPLSLVNYTWYTDSEVKDANGKITPRLIYIKNGEFGDV